MIGTTRYIPYRIGIVMMTVSNLNKRRPISYVSHAGIDIIPTGWWFVILAHPVSRSNFESSCFWNFKSISAWLAQVKPRFLFLSHILLLFLSDPSSVYKMMERRDRSVQQLGREVNRWQEEEARFILWKKSISNISLLSEEVAAAVLAIAAALRRTTSPSYLFPVSALTAINPCTPPSRCARNYWGLVTPAHLLDGDRTLFLFAIPSLTTLKNEYFFSSFEENSNF